MRIALDLSGVNEYTGVRVYAEQLLRELRKANTEHELFVIMRRRDSNIYNTDGPDVTALFIPTVAEDAISNIAWHWSDFPSYLRRRKIDLVHQMDCNRVSPLGKLRHVVTVHGLIDSRVPGRRHFWRQRYNEHVVPRLLSLPTKIISVSDNTRRDLLKYTSIPNDKIAVIREGCALDDICQLDVTEARSLLKTSYGLQDTFVLYVARLEHPNKNHVLLLKAYAHLLHERGSLPPLVFVGSDSYRADAVRNAVESLGLTRHVTLTGFVPLAHLKAFYRCALAYVCPTLYEGFGLPLLEAMTAGVPIACSNTSSLPEVAGNAALTFDPSSLSSIENALKTLISDEKSRNLLIKAGFEQVKQFSAGEMARQTLDIYQSVKRAEHNHGL
jgi:glycosyltransferase involved in cell wall biosynthesis